MQQDGDQLDAPISEDPADICSVSDVALLRPGNQTFILDGDDVWGRFSLRVGMACGSIFKRMTPHCCITIYVLVLWFHSNLTVANTHDKRDWKGQLCEHQSARPWVHLC